MRGRLLPTLLAALTAFVLGAGSAPAATSGGHITPGGPFTGTGGPLNWPFPCQGSTIAGQFNSFGNELGVIDEVSYEGCSSFFTVDISVDVPWTLTGVGHSDGVTSIDIDNIAGTITGPGCNFEVAGQAGTTFDNATSILTVHQDNSMVISVDPANDCLGLVNQGEHIAVLSDSYAINPPQVIVPA